MENWKASMMSHSGVKMEWQGRVVYSLLFPRTEFQTEKWALYREGRGAMWETINILRKIEIDFYSKLGHLKDVRKMYYRVTGWEVTKENVLQGSLDKKWQRAGR